MRTKIPPHFSVYLDLVRFTAALGVVVYHLKTFAMGPLWLLRFLPGLGHECVVVFFVLSGYVIAGSVDRSDRSERTERKHAPLVDYALDRMARVYSVAVPTLLLSTVVALWLQIGTAQDVFVGALANLLFVGQSWSANLMPPSNPPFWSLCYEVMYYALFGCAVYLRGAPRIISCLMVALLAGPKVLLLLPCWLVGVATYRLRDRLPLTALQAALLGLALPAGAIAAMTMYKLGAKVESLFGADLQLGASRQFAKDYVTSLLVALHLYSLRWLDFTWPEPLRRAVVAGAAFTFTLYLINYPIIMIVRRTAVHSSLPGLGLTVLSLAVATYIVGSVTEARRRQLRTWLARWISTA